jgi:SAM-dependent methyltransferase
MTEDNLDFSTLEWSDFLEATADRDHGPLLSAAWDFIGEDGTGRTVIDFGCGGGADTRWFLDRGWTVHAVDAAPEARQLLLDRVAASHLPRLTIDIGLFHEVELPPADLVYASFSLPFAGPDLDAALANGLGAVTPGGAFYGNLFGHRDTWASDPLVASVDRAYIDRAFSDFSEVRVDETEQQGPFGMEGDLKNWHFYVVAAKR